MSDQTLSRLSPSYFSAGYPRRKAIENLTVPHLSRGRITTLLGPNDSSRSTLMQTIAGLGSYRGELLLEGEDLLTQPSSRHAEQVAYLPRALPTGVYLHVLGSIIVAQRAAGGHHSPQHQERVTALLQRPEIAHLAASYLDQFSGRQKQPVGLAQSLIRQPRLLLFDESLSALDLSYRFHVMDLARRETRRRNIVTLVVVHDTNIALRYTDHILMLKTGQLLGDGTPTMAITPEALAAIYGVCGCTEPYLRGVRRVIIDSLVDSEV